MSTQPTVLGQSLPSPSEPPLIQSSIQKNALLRWAILAVIMTVLGYLYADSLRFLGESWLEDNNSHGPFIPLIVLYMMWLRWPTLHAIEHRGSWWGVSIVGLGLCVYAVGQFAAMHAVVHLSLWMVIIGLLSCAIGLAGIRRLTFPLLYLLAAVPLPVFLQYELSSKLQLWSSTLGVGFLHAIGVTAYREGNVIDLGPTQLQVVEACSGLRYLFPLMALTLLMAYLYRESYWKRAALVLSSIPISILLNGFRIGVIGILVGFYGQAAAEGFTHFFEGWIFFVASLALLCGEMWVLARIGSAGPRRSFAELIALPATGDALLPHGGQPAAAMSFAPLVVAGGLLAVAVVAAPTINPEEFPPPPSRQQLVDFPLQLGGVDGGHFSSGATVSRCLGVGRLCDGGLHDGRSPSGQCLRGLLSLSEEGSFFALAETMHSGWRMGNHVF
jgi:eight transmembrane protein EpsH (proposed exosortase)